MGKESSTLGRVWSSSGRGTGSEKLKKMIAIAGHPGMVFVPAVPLWNVDSFSWTLWCNKVVVNARSCKTVELRSNRKVCDVTDVRCMGR